MSQHHRTLAGRLVSVAGKAEIAGIEVWFAYRTVPGDDATCQATTGADGSFVFDLPSVPLDQAKVGAHLEGLEPVDLKPEGKVLEPGDVVLLIDDLLPTHLRYAG
jgi:hypothetical protein